jgi:hypothetical protein
MISENIWMQKREVTQEWKELCNEYFLHQSGLVLVYRTKEYITGGGCSTHGGDEKCIQDFNPKTRRKRPLGKPKHGWEK